MVITVIKISESFIEIKKSKFYGYLYEIENINEVKEILNLLIKEHKNLRHMPYAYTFNNSAYKTDDHEPVNTAGIQILNNLQRNNLNNHLLVVVRYFGGTKLGVSVLLRTYRKCANECIKK